MRNAYSLLFGPRLHRRQKLLPFVGDAGEREVYHLVKGRGAGWAEMAAARYRRAGYDYSAALLEAAIILDGRSDGPALTPTGQMVLYKIVSETNGNRGRISQGGYLAPHTVGPVLAYLFPGLPGEKTPMNLRRNLDQPSVPSLLALTAELIEEGYDGDDIHGEIMRRRTLRSFKRRADDFVTLEGWMTTRPDFEDEPAWWRTVCQKAAALAGNDDLLDVTLADPETARRLARQLSGEEVGLAKMLAAAHQGD